MYMLVGRDKQMSWLEGCRQNAMMNAARRTCWGMLQAFRDNINVSTPSAQAFLLLFISCPSSASIATLSQPRDLMRQIGSQAMRNE